MNENEIIKWFQIIVSVIGFTLGVLSLFFTKKLNERQVKYAAKHKDDMNQRIAKGLSAAYIPILTKIIGVIFIVFFGYRLIKIIILL